MLCELKNLGKEMLESQAKQEKIALNEAEFAFYNILLKSQSNADSKLLQEIATSIYTEIKKNVKLDWSKKENLKAELRVKVKKILAKYDFLDKYKQSLAESIITQAQEFDELVA